jgi:hypothetical protein
MDKSPYSIRYTAPILKAGKSSYIKGADVSIAEFQDFVKARAAIDSQILQYHQLYEMAAITYDNLANALKECIDNVRHWRGIDARGDLTKLNAYYTAYIANFGMYHSCARRMIGSDRKEILSLHERATHEEYDTHFGYKLFCNLRNYALHNLPPLTGIRGSSNKKSEDYTYEVFFEKDKLLEDSKFANKMRGDLEKHDGDLHLIDLANEAMHSLELIHWKTIKALLEPVGNEIALIQKIAGATPDNKQPYVAELLRKVGDKEDLTLHLVPIQVLEIQRIAQGF